jgi:hypothetical protein
MPYLMREWEAVRGSLLTLWSLDRTNYSLFLRKIFIPLKDKMKGEDLKHQWELLRIAQIPCLRNKREILVAIVTKVLQA